MDTSLEIAASLRFMHGNDALITAQRELFSAAADHDAQREALMGNVCALLLEQQAGAKHSAA